MAIVGLTKLSQKIEKIKVKVKMPPPANQVADKLSTIELVMPIFEDSEPGEHPKRFLQSLNIFNTKNTK